MTQTELDFSVFPDDYFSDDCSFDSINNGDLSYSEFFSKFLLPNRPCVIKNVTSNWKSPREWVVNGAPNFSYLASMFGDVDIPTANCKEKYYNSHSKGSMKLSDYMNYWKEYRSSGHPETMPCLYLKDWHCFRENPDQEWYKVPQYFASDWLNEYYMAFPNLKDDYRFVYMGPKGTWTPLHKDVFSSFSWSVNICGQKAWVFYPPDQVSLLTDSLGNLAFDVAVDKNKLEFHGLSEAKSCPLEQGPGDAVFVPSGWYHQVWNRDDTISINHNWINACNVDQMFSNLLFDLRSVEKELADCLDSQEWHSDCQRLLKATFGFDLEDFYHFILYISKRRLSSFKCNSELNLYSGHSMGLNHLKFDLSSAQNVLKRMSSLCYPSIDKKEIDVFVDNINKVIDSG